MRFAFESLWNIKEVSKEVILLSVLALVSLPTCPLNSDYPPVYINSFHLEVALLHGEWFLNEYRTDTRV